MVISGTMCDTVAVGGNVGKSRCPSCTDVIVLPSGIVIRIGDVDQVVVWCGEMSGASGVKDRGDVILDGGT